MFQWLCSYQEQSTYVSYYFSNSHTYLNIYLSEKYITLERFIFNNKQPM